MNVPPFPEVEFIESDGVPMDNAWHRDCMTFLIEQVRFHCRDRQDYFVGGNMFIYFSPEQARNRDFLGPDFFYVEGVRYDQHRPYYVVWREENHYPNVIVELLSASTETEDRTTKKDVYEKIFHTPEYYLYDPDTRQLDGFRHDGGQYQPIEPDVRGRLWCEQLHLWLGTWTGEYQGASNVWLRFYEPSGDVVPLFAEAVAKERDEAQQNAKAALKERDEAQQNAKAALKERDEAQRRAEDAEARLRSLLGDPPEAT